MESLPAQNDIIDYLRLLKEMGGSDLHITVGRPPLMRRDGVLQPLAEHDLTAEQTRDALQSLLTERQRAILEKEWELDFVVHLEGGARYRGNAHYIRGTVQAAFRLINSSVPTIEQLGHYEVVPELCELREGLILVTGITGSGKSTTLAAMVEYLSRHRSGVIISIEDPIEYVFEHQPKCIIKQREVGGDTKDFATALRQALRQDPDVILVSELRDLETIRTAITAAETGHLVISTLHTMDAPKSLDRIIDVFPAMQQPQIRAQLANCLRAVISQRLLPHVSGRGRVLASEVMVMNHGIRACLRQGKYEQIPGLMQIGSIDGMHTLDECLAHLVLTAKISLDEAMAEARDPTLLNSLLAPKKRR